ncbi:MAG: hypothetical protein ACMUHX_09625, partial [bacterium]
MKCSFKRYSMFLFTATLICLIIGLSGLNAGADMVSDPSSFYIAYKDPNDISRQWNAQIVASSTGYLCVWDNYNDILGRFIDLNGENLGAQINITSDLGNGNQNEPDIATDGVKYLVVWSDGGEFNYNHDIYGRFVYVNGTIGEAFLIDAS